MAITANALHGDRSRYDYLSKPVDMETLEQTLAMWINSPKAVKVFEAKETAALQALASLDKRSGRDSISPALHRALDYHGSLTYPESIAVSLCRETAEVLASKLRERPSAGNAGFVNIAAAGAHRYLARCAPVCCADISL